MIDGLEANFRCIVDFGETPPATRERELAAETEPARRGKAFSNLGRFAEARAALEEALGADPESSQARTWLGEVHLLEGRFEDAARELDRALASRDPYPWSRFFRAAAHFAVGDMRAAAADLRELAETEGDPALAARAFSGLLDFHRGAFEEAVAAFDAVAAARPQDGWPLALRARAHKGRGDVTNALADLQAAVEKSAAAWVLLERSRLFEEIGDLNHAVEDTEAVRERYGADVSLAARLAHLQVCRRHYHLAIPHYTEALELAPGDAELLLARARVHAIRGHFDLALKDTAQAAKSGAAAHVLEDVVMRIRSGKTAGADKTLAKLAKDAALGAEVALARGWLAMKKRDFKAATKFFDAAPLSKHVAGFERKVSFYRSVAEGLRGFEDRGMPKPKKGRGMLLISGLGIHPPFTAQLDALRAAMACDLVFNNLSEPEIAELLNVLAPKTIPSMFDIRGAGDRWTKSVLGECAPGKTVGFITRGHALVCGGLACSLIMDADSRGVDYRIFPSVSSMDTVAMRTLGPSAAPFEGVQALDYHTILDEPFAIDATLPTIVYLHADIMAISKGHYERMCENLEKSFAPDHGFFFFGRNFDVLPERMPLKALRGYHGKFDPSFTFLIPPLHRGGGKR